MKLLCFIFLMPFPLMILINVRRILKSRHKWRIQHFICYYMRLVILLGMSNFFIFTIITLNKFRLFVKLVFTFPWLISFILLAPWIIWLFIVFFFLMIKLLLSGAWLPNGSWFIRWIFNLNSCRLLSNFLINNALDSVFFFIFQDLSFDFRFNLMIKPLHGWKYK